MKIFIALLLLLGNVYIHAQSNYNELFTRGEEFRSKGLYTKALPYYEKAEKVVKANSHKLALWRVMAESYKETADYNKSRLYYEQILHTFKNFPYKDDVLLNLSDIYLLTGYYEKVIELLSPLNLRKGEDKRLINLSNAYAQTGNSQNALALLDTAISQHATSKDSIFRSAIQNKGYILWNIKRHKEAFELLSSALSLYTENDADRYLCLGNLAIVESELGDSAKEQSYFKKALAHIDEAISWQQINIGNTHPDYIISLRKKAEILLKMNALPEATTQFKIYFEKEKDYIISNFAYMTEQERINFWNTKKKVLAECYATEGFDPDFLFDVAVFSKSVLLQTNINIWQLVSGNQEYTQLYERLHELRLLLRSSTGKERQTLQKEYEQQERLLMNRVNAYKFFLDNLKVNGKDISRALTNQSDKAIEFIQYLKNDTTRYAALVMQKNKAVRFIPMFTLEEIEQYTIQNKKNFGTLKEAIYSRKIIDKNHLYSDTIFEKKIAAIMIKVVINSSIRNKMRTKEDWQNFHQEKKAIEDDCVVETTIDRLSFDDKPVEEKSSTSEQPSRTLKDYLHGNQEQILEKIKLRVSTQHTGTDLARLYFALQEEELLTGCDVTTFHKLLANELPNCDLKTVRNLQISIKKLNDSTNRGRIKDNGIERSLINEWKTYLTEVNN